jgi:hypothetical protein
MEERAPDSRREDRLRELNERVRALGRATRPEGRTGSSPAPERPADVRHVAAPPVERTRPRTYREAAREFYANPAAARRAFLAAAERRAADRAAALFRDEPQRFGRLRRGADPARSVRAADAAYDYARQHAGRDRAALRQAAGLLREVDAHQRGQRTLDLLAREAERAAREPARLAKLQRDSLHAARALQGAAPHVYADPARALREAEAYRARFGVEAAARVIREAPERFGQLRGATRSRFLGLARVTTYDDARSRAGELADTFRSAALAAERCPRAGDVERATRHARDAADAVEKARSALQPVNAQAHVREAASRLMSAQIGRRPERAAQLGARLLPMLPTSGVHLVRQAIRMGRELAEGHDHERERGRDRGLSL